MSQQETSYYLNCSGAKLRKKKIQQKEKLNIFAMHDKMVEYFNSQSQNIQSEIEKKLKKISLSKIPYGIDEEQVNNIFKKYNIKHTPNKEIAYYEIKTELESIKNLEEKIQNLPLEELKYTNGSISILKKTKDLIDTPVQINFFNKKQSINNNEKELDKLRKDMILLCKSFVDFSSDIEEIKVEENKNVCECGNENFLDDETNNICMECGRILIKFNTNNITYKDSDRVSFSQKYKYEKINHFKNTIRQFQGTQNKRIDKEVLEDLEKSLEKDKIINNSLPNPYYKLTKEHLRNYLDHTGHNKNYKDINLIYQHFTGKSCPKILDDLYNKLLEDFEKLVETFIDISKKEDKIDRTNFLNSEYVLYQLLIKYGFPCEEKDFALPRSTKCRVDQEKIYILLCEKLHWSYISIL